VRGNRRRRGEKEREKSESERSVEDGNTSRGKKGKVELLAGRGLEQKLNRRIVS
jgi:hypothetical protein